jgi:hypothetical protein
MQVIRHEAIGVNEEPMARACAKEGGLSQADGAPIGEDGRSPPGYEG